MGSDVTVKTLAGMRIGIGALAWVRPDLVAKLFGLRAPGNGQEPYLWRLFAIRDVVLGVGTLTARTSERKAWLKFGIACDASDGIAAALGKRDGYVPTRAAAPLVAVPAIAVALGALAAKSA